MPVASSTLSKACPCDLKSEGVCRCEHQLQTFHGESLSPSQTNLCLENIETNSNRVANMRRHQKQVLLLYVDLTCIPEYKSWSAVAIT